MSERTKVIVAGSRDLVVRTEPTFGPTQWLDTLLRTAFKTHYPQYDLEIVSGGSGNMDELGEQWAVLSGCDAVTFFHADWSKHGKAAGPIRNREMADYADALVLIWDGESRGSANMLHEATKRGLRVIEVRI